MSIFDDEHAEGELWHENCLYPDVDVTVVMENFL